MLRLFFVLFLFFVFGSKANETLQFSLQRIQNGTPVTVTRDSFPDKYLLIAVGYTGCPDICPTTLLDMKNMLLAMDSDHTDKVNDIKPLFITIDPTVDTLDNITQYVGYFDERIVGLRADDWEKLDAVVNQLRASYGYQVDGKAVFPPDLPDKYTVYHSTYIYLYSPQGQLLDIYPYNMDGKTLAERVVSQMY